MTSLEVEPSVGHHPGQNETQSLTMPCLRPGPPGQSRGCRKRWLNLMRWGRDLGEGQMGPGTLDPPLSLKPCQVPNKTTPADQPEYMSSEGVSGTLGS